MSLLELMRTRRSIREFTEEPIPEEVLFKIMEAGCASMDLMKTLAEGSIDAGYLEEIKKGNFF